MPGNTTTTTTPHCLHLGHTGACNHVSVYAWGYSANSTSTMKANRNLQHLFEKKMWRSKGETYHLVRVGCLRMVPSTTSLLQSVIRSSVSSLNTTLKRIHSSDAFKSKRWLALIYRTIFSRVIIYIYSILNLEGSSTKWQESLSW